LVINQGFIEARRAGDGRDSDLERLLLRDIAAGGRPRDRGVAAVVRSEAVDQEPALGSGLWPAPKGSGADGMCASAALVVQGQGPTAALAYEQQIAQARSMVSKDPARAAQVVKGWVQGNE
jgi:flagellar biosynthesis/type III secretory pathway M-ring protein FliF/YscJ